MSRLVSSVVLTGRGFSASIWVMIVLALGAGVLLRRSAPPHDDREVALWVFSPEHELMYRSWVAGDTQTEHPVDITLMSIAAIKSRMMSGFFGGLPTADLIEVERADPVGQVFMGPTDAIGFTDLTDRLREEGMLESFNPPSLSPWSVDGRVFGLPHDVHPVMLAYRADLVEGAGIDLQQAQTWDEFFAMLRPMMDDRDGDGRPDRYPLGFWYTQQDNIELLLLQGGGALFDEEGLPTLNRAKNAELVAEMISWCVGDGRVALDVEEFSAAGHQSRVDGDAIAYLCPDWMCSIWKMHVPKIGGKMKLMPLPAFEPGGRRTSVRGGTMLGIPKTTEDFDASWEVAKRLYTSPTIARELYEKVDIISPVRERWDDPIYDEPDPFFMGQPKGRMYIELAGDIPLRSSSPYNLTGLLMVRDVAVNLARWAEENHTADPEALAPKAQEMLDAAQDEIVRIMKRNRFTKVGQ